MLIECKEFKPSKELEADAKVVIECDKGLIGMANTIATLTRHLAFLRDESCRIALYRLERELPPIYPYHRGKDQVEVYNDGGKLLFVIERGRREQGKTWGDLKNSKEEKGE